MWPSMFCHGFSYGSVVTGFDIVTGLNRVSSISPSCFFPHQSLLDDVGRPVRPPSPPTLDIIVEQYLREQHAHCNNPVSTCPPFSLLR